MVTHRSLPWTSGPHGVEGGGKVTSKGDEGQTAGTYHLGWERGERQERGR